MDSIEVSEIWAERQEGRQMTPADGVQLGEEATDDYKTFAGKLQQDHDVVKDVPRQPRGPVSREFKVSAEKSGFMGMDVVLSRDGKALLVAGVKEGTVHDWNCTEHAAGREDTIVCRGDRIVEVNDSGRGDGAAVSRALQSASGTMTMTIVKLMEFMLKDLPNLPRSLLAAGDSRSGGLGLEYAEDEFGDLVLTKVGPKVNKALQPDMELRPGDRIVKVNGSTVMLRAKALSDDTLTLRVRRPDVDHH